jgi:hypothetical protein
MALRSTGARSKPSGNRDLSRLHKRFRPKVPANVKVTHNTPEVTLARSLASSSRAKLKIRMTSKAKTSIDESNSLLRSSAAKSFHTTADNARQ